MSLTEPVNWALRGRVEDNTRDELGWSYRTTQIEIILLQEIRDELRLQRQLLAKVLERACP